MNNKLITFLYLCFLLAALGCSKKPQKPENKQINLSESWSFKSEVSPLDDKPIVFIFKESNESVKVGYKTIRPVLFIRFKEGNLSCFINYGIFLGTGYTSVTMRMDKKDPRTHKWEISNNRESIFYPSGVKWFVDNLIESKTLLIQVTPYGESTITNSFDLKGIQESIKPILTEFQKLYPN
jgi:type VI secretion system protein VasI